MLTFLSYLFKGLIMLNVMYITKLESENENKGYVIRLPQRDCRL